MGYFNIHYLCLMFLPLLTHASMVFGKISFSSPFFSSSSSASTKGAQMQINLKHGHDHPGYDPDRYVHNVMDIMTGACVLWTRSEPEMDPETFLVTLTRTSSRFDGQTPLREPKLDSETISVSNVTAGSGQTEGVISLPTLYSGNFYLVATSYDSRGEILARSEDFRVRPRFLRIVRTWDDDDDDDDDDHDKSSASQSKPTSSSTSSQADTSGADSTPNDSMSTDTPLIIAAVLGTILVCLIMGIIIYLLRRRWRNKEKASDNEYPFNPPNKINSRAFPLTERQVPPMSQYPPSHSQPTDSTNTIVEYEAEACMGLGGPRAEEEAGRDPWESRNFYATPKQRNPHRVENISGRRGYGNDRSGGGRSGGSGSLALSGASRSTKSSNNSLVRGVRRGRRAGLGSSVTNGTSESMTEVSSIHFSPVTERQMEIDERIQELQGKLSLLQRTVTGGTSRDARTGSVTLANMTHDFRVWKWKRQIEKLKGLKDSDWAWGKTDVVPAGLYKFDGTSTSNL